MFDMDKIFIGKNYFLLVYFIRMKKIIEIIKKILWVQFKIETFVGKIIPPYGYIINLRNSFFQYELKEKEVFIKHMPKWYAFYESNILMCILRILMCCWLIFSKLIKMVFEAKLNIDLDAYILTDLITLFIIFIFLFVATLKFFLSFRYKYCR